MSSSSPSSLSSKLRNKLWGYIHEKHIASSSPLNKQIWDPTEGMANLRKFLRSPVHQAALSVSYATTAPMTSAQNAVSQIPAQDERNYYMQKDPYTSANKIQFEEAFRADGIVRRALLRKADFIFAKGVKTALDVMNDDFTTYEERQNALSKLVSNQEYRQAKAQVDKVNRRVNFRHYARAAYMNCKIYGRSGLVKEYAESEDGYPSKLYILNPKLMGNIYCDKKTHEIAYVEYNSTDSEQYNTKTFYTPSDLIYLTNVDIHVSPNTLGYGLSEIEAVKDISETNRSIDERAFKEIAFSQWAGTPIFQVPNMTEETDISAIADAYEPGRAMAINSEISITSLETPNDLNGLIELRTQADKRILRNLGIPSFALGFETDANRATAQFVLHAWKESFVEQERTWLKDIIQAQWINPLWAQALNIPVEDVYELDVKLTAEFIDYNFDTFSENVDAWLPMVQNGYISVQDFLDKIGQPDLAEKYKELEKKQQAEQQKQQQFAATLANQQPQQQQLRGQRGFGRKMGVTNDPTANLGGGDSSGESSAL